MRQHSIRGMGGRPRWQSVTSRVLSGRAAAPPGTSEKARCRGRSALRGRGGHDSQGEGAHGPELVARAQRGATYLGAAWNNGATAMNALSAGRPRASKHNCSRSRFSQAPFSRSTWPNCRRKARRIPKFGRCWALLGAPPVHGRGRQSPDQAGDMAAKLVGWSSGELPSQGDRTAGLTAARHPSAADQPQAGV